MAEKTAYFFLRTSVGKDTEVVIRKFDDGAPVDESINILSSGGSIMSKKNVYLLMRNSVPENSEAVLRRQDMELRDYCQRNDYNIVGVVKVIGDSGDVALALNDIIRQSDTQQNIDALVTTSMDRISRDTSEALSIRDALASHGLELEAADGSHMNLEALNEIAKHTAEYEADEMCMHFGM